MLDKHFGHPFGREFGASIWQGTRLQELSGFYVTQGHSLPVVLEKPLHVVQEKLKTFNAGQAFETEPELHNFFTDSHFHLDKLLDELKVNTLKEVQDKHQQDHSLDFAIRNYVYPEKWHTIQADIISNPNIMYTIGVHPNRIFYPN